MTDPVLFEAPYRGERWRFTLSSYGGSLRLSVRAFWQNHKGEWCPTKREDGKGFTLPLDAMHELGEAITAASRQIDSSGAPSAS